MEVPAFHIVTGGEPLGELIARGELQKMCEGRGKLFPIDEILGDDRFVFLSIGAPLKGGNIQTTCFLFDAEELIRAGALLRTTDILMTAEAGRVFLALDNAKDRPRWQDVQDLTREDIKSLIRNDFEVAQTFDALRKKRDQITFSGDEALRRVRDCKLMALSPQCELLVPWRLAISKAFRAAPKSAFETKI